LGHQIHVEIYPPSTKAQLNDYLGTTILEDLVDWISENHPTAYAHLREKKGNLPVTALGDLSQESSLVQWLIPRIQQLYRNATLVPTLGDLFLGGNRFNTGLWLNYGPHLEFRCWIRTGKRFEQQMERLRAIFKETPLLALPTDLKGSLLFDEAIGLESIIRELKQPFYNQAFSPSIDQLYFFPDRLDLPFSDYVKTNATIHITKGYPYSADLNYAIKGWDPEIRYTGDFLSAHAIMVLNETVSSEAEFINLVQGESDDQVIFIAKLAPDSEEGKHFVKKGSDFKTRSPKKFTKKIREKNWVWIAGGIF